MHRQRLPSDILNAAFAGAKWSSADALRLVARLPPAVLQEVENSIPYPGAE